jgi:uncharacterized protein (DUF4415 family)
MDAREIRNARPQLNALPPETAAAVRRYRGQRGPQKAPTKELISLRVDRDVVAAYRSRGPGWQARAKEALKAGLAERSKGRRATNRTRAGRRASR